MASMTDPLDPNLAARLTKSINGLFAGSYLAGVFYGLTTHQTFVYFRGSGKDPLYTRFFVLLLWILDTLQAVFAAVALLKLTEESIANPLSILLNRVPWTLSVGYYAFFLKLLHDNLSYYLDGRLVLVVYDDSTVIESGGQYAPPTLPTRKDSSSLMDAVGQVFSVICPLVAALYSTSQTVQKTGLQALNLVAELDVTLILICVADSILAGTLCVLLWNNRSGIKRDQHTDPVYRNNGPSHEHSGYSYIDHGEINFMMYREYLSAIDGGPFIPISQLLTMEGTFAYAGAFYMLSKLYLSSLLATLNRREKIRTQMEATTEMISVPLDSTGFGKASALKRISIPIFASEDSDDSDDVSTTV
ncbi:hypothetical protein CVT25_002838 [Psilocybe cyanescens]|uniref:DUF6534 domain-containing protein n=1 Tax=Psilocybe cyanescens TaxID=93625 RepID=A0A409XR35_PSICY|nr:hypothetical protein CVT25_002838 [Psilocybe cyanescens]